MRQISKKFLFLVLAAAILFSCIATVSADSHTIIYKNRRDLFDFGSGTSFSDTDLFTGFKNVMPGDTLYESVTIKNSSSDCAYIKVYLKAKPHNGENLPKSEAVSAKESLESMNDFLSKLSMKVWQGEKLLFSASPNAADGLTNSVLLGTFFKGDSATLNIEFSMPLELDNRYANRLGEVDWTFAVEAFDRPSDPPSSSKTNLTVRKLWDDDGKNRPESIEVNLLKNGKVDKTVELSAENQWTYTWGGLSKLYEWSVGEKSVPDGYTAEYDRSGNTVIITNKANPTDDPDDPNTPVDPDNPDDPNNPNTPGSSKPSDDDKNNGDSNNPSNTPAPPNDSENENTENNLTPNEAPVSLTVKKAWEDDGKNRPESVAIQLYNGEKAVETVHLGEWNNWKYTWDNLSSDGCWQAVEVDIPKGYTPSYKVDGTTVYITNSAILIQTGQRILPIIILTAAGAVIIITGLYIIKRKERVGR